MNIQLTGVKHAKFASQETNCFEATIVIDGRNMGKVYNEGHGGCHSYSSDEAYRLLTQHAKTLPDVVSTTLMDPHDRSKPFSYKMDADHVVDDLFMEAMHAKDLKRLLKTKVLIIRGDKLLAASIRKDETFEMVAPKVVKQGDMVLNGLSDADAMTLYRKYG